MESRVHDRDSNDMTELEQGAAFNRQGELLLRGSGWLGRLMRAYPTPARFLNWWLRELLCLVPRKLYQFLGRSDRQLWIEMQNGEAVFSLWQRGRRVEIGKITLDDRFPDREKVAVDALLSGIKADEIDVVVRLPRNQCLFWSLVLPAGAEADLAQALRFQIETRTPYAVEETLFDYRIRDRSGDTLAVDMVVAPRLTARPILAKIEAWGRAPAALDISPDENGPAPSFNLLPNAEPRVGGRFLTPTNAALTALVVGLVIASVFLPFEQRASRLDALKQKLSVATSIAEQTRGLREDVKRLSADSAFVMEKKALSPARVEVLDQLSRLLPDHTSLSELRISGLEIRVVGRSSSASNLIGLIGGSAMFANPKFRSPITQEQRSGLERFDLSFAIKKKGDTP